VNQPVHLDGSKLSLKKNVDSEIWSYKLIHVDVPSSCYHMSCPCCAGWINQTPLGSPVFIHWSENSAGCYWTRSSKHTPKHTRCFIQSSPHSVPSDLFKSSLGKYL